MRAAGWGTLAVANFRSACYGDHHRLQTDETAFNTGGCGSPQDDPSSRRICLLAEGGLSFSGICSACVKNAPGGEAWRKGPPATSR
eukprot:397478-Rhodomonas_salina.1